MRVLLLTQVLPYPPSSGPQVKTFAVARALAAEHELSIVSFVRGDESAAARRLEEIGARVYGVPLRRSNARNLWHAGRALLRGLPFLMARDDSASMRQRVETLAAAQRFDVVHVDQLNMAQYAALVPGARRVLDLHNALWKLAQRLADNSEPHWRRRFLAREARLLRHYEAEACAGSDVVLTVSDADRQELVAAAAASGVHLPVERLQVVPIALDPSLIPDGLRPPPRVPRLLHLGTLAWPPNAGGLLWLLREVWPQVRRLQPQATLDVIGQRPPRSVRAAAQAAPGVRLHGFVDDLTSALCDSSVLVVPLHAGSGMRVKILTAMAHGIPVVSTGLGCEGIDVEDGKHLLVADDPGAFAAAVRRILQEPDLGATLARNGRALIDARYNAKSTLLVLREIYSRLARSSEMTVVHHRRTADPAGMSSV
jgi:glycosyltransferase involved in cell wall biosynthesis